MTLIIAHRGSSGSLPENTLESFKLAIEQDVGGIELDIIATKDFHLIVRHDVTLSRSTNVADIKKFSNKKSIKLINGEAFEDWFAIDFTLEEIKELKCTQPYVDRLQDYNLKFTIPTLKEVIDLININNLKKETKIDLLIEIKNSTFHSEHFIILEDLLFNILDKEELNTLESYVKIMSFEVNCLKYIRRYVNNEIFQLFEEFDLETDTFLSPYDLSLQKSKVTYKDMISKNGLEEVKEYANGICLWKGYLLDNKFNLNIKNQEFFTYLKKINLKVFIWTLSNKNILKNSTSLFDEYSKFYYSGVDGIITDYPEIATKLAGKSQV
ncbi:MAG: glycerophosphodiester phosphodiesterase family protein [Solirubrobacteraceae bacterium]